MMKQVPRDGSQKTESSGHQREQNPLDSERRIESGGQDDGADILGRGGFEQVRAAARAVAHVVAHQIRDHGGIAMVVLRNPRFHLAHQVRTHIGGFCVDTPAELREERHKTGAEAKGHNLAGHHRGVVQAAESQKQ